MNYTKYHVPTGNITGYGNGDIVGNLPADVSVLYDVLATPERHYVRNGKVVEYTLAQASAKASRPEHRRARWDNDLMAWVDLRTVEDARAPKKHEVDLERARRSVIPVTYGGSPFDADTLARERISGTLSRLVRGDGLPTGWVGWRDADNQMHWTYDDAATVQAHLSGLSRAIEDREQALLIAAWTHKAQIDALPTVAEVEAYDVTTGWPA